MVAKRQFKCCASLWRQLRQLAFKSKPHADPRLFPRPPSLPNGLGACVAMPNTWWLCVWALIKFQTRLLAHLLGFIPINYFLFFFLLDFAFISNTHARTHTQRVRFANLKFAFQIQKNRRTHTSHIKSLQNRLESTHAHTHTNSIYIYMCVFVLVWFFRRMILPYSAALKVSVSFLSQISNISA